MARCCFEIQSSSLLSLAPGPASANSTAASKAILLAPKAWKSTAPANSDPSTGAIKDANAGKRVVSWVFRTFKVLLPRATGIHAQSKKNAATPWRALTTSVSSPFWAFIDLAPESSRWALPWQFPRLPGVLPIHSLHSWPGLFLEAESKSPHICCDLIWYLRSHWVPIYLATVCFVMFATLYFWSCLKPLLVLLKKNGRAFGGSYVLNADPLSKGLI